jgi:NADPH-dependent 2,4-dienoyl-CoA reductase/sulfur reductase-like enzyme
MMARDNTRFAVRQGARSRYASGVSTQPHVVIVGAGFAGLACAKALGNAQARVTVIDRANYHLFVPLLYQVATAALSPADIARPIRRILGRYRNIAVVLGEVTAIDTAAARAIPISATPAGWRTPRARAAWKTPASSGRSC